MEEGGLNLKKPIPSPSSESSSPPPPSSFASSLPSSSFPQLNSSISSFENSSFFSSFENSSSFSWTSLCTSGDAATIHVDKNEEKLIDDKNIKGKNQQQEKINKKTGIKSSLNLHAKGRIEAGDIQQLILWVFSGRQSARSSPSSSLRRVPTPSWISIKKKNEINHIVVVLYPYANISLIISLLDNRMPFFRSNCISMPCICKMRSTLVDRSVRCSFVQSLLLNCESLEKKKPDKSSAVYPVSAYLLTESELVENGYPMKNDKATESYITFECATSGVPSPPEESEEPSVEKSKDSESEFTEVKSNKRRNRRKQKQTQNNKYVLEEDADYAKMLSIDCEMCMTEGNALEIARVSIVDTNLNVILDMYVQPKNKIVDYLTKYSGIDSNTLKDVTARLEDVHEKLKHIIHKDTILVGHSLENDLHALRLRHERIIDTSVIFPHPKPPNKSSLKWLVARYLSRQMQRKFGHNSVDDAVATMQLTLLKLRNGMAFGGLREQKTLMSMGQLLSETFGKNLSGEKCSENINNSCIKNNNNNKNNNNKHICGNMSSIVNANNVNNQLSNSTGSESAYSCNNNNNNYDSNNNNNNINNSNNAISNTSNEILVSSNRHMNENDGVSSSNNTNSNNNNNNNTNSSNMPCCIKTIHSSHNTDICTGEYDSTNSLITNIIEEKKINEGRENKQTNEDEPKNAEKKEKEENEEIFFCNGEEKVLLIDSIPHQTHLPMGAMFRDTRVVLGKNDEEVYSKMIDSLKEGVCPPLTVCVLRDMQRICSKKCNMHNNRFHKFSARVKKLIKYDNFLSSKKKKRKIDDMLCQEEEKESNEGRKEEKINDEEMKEEGEEEEEEEKEKQEKEKEEEKITKNEKKEEEISSSFIKEDALAESDVDDSEEEGEISEPNEDNLFKRGENDEFTCMSDDPPVLFPEVLTEEKVKHLTKLDMYVQKIFEQLDTNDLLVVVSNCGDAARYLSLSAARHVLAEEEKEEKEKEKEEEESEKENKTEKLKWTSKLERELQIARGDFYEAWGFFAIK